MAIIKTAWLDIIYGHNQCSCENSKKNMNAVCRELVQVLNFVGQGTVHAVFRTKIWCYISGYLNRRMSRKVRHQCCMICYCRKLSEYSITRIPEAELLCTVRVN